MAAEEAGEPVDLVGAAQRVAEEFLAPRAEETDRAALLPRANLDALAEVGLFGLACGGPAGHDGSAVSAAVMRAVQEALAGACGATYFVWAQHHSPVRLLSTTANQPLAQRWLGPLCRGESLAGVAFAYLRRQGPAAVRAERVPGGWRVSGTAPFVTSWGLADVFVVAALAAPASPAQVGRGDQIIWFCLDGVASGQVQPSAPLELSVLQSTGTVVLRLDELLVGDLDVIMVEPLAAWRERDRVATARPPAAALGVARRCCQLLSELPAAQAGSGPLAEAAGAFSDELRRCRDHSYALADGLDDSNTELPVDTAPPGSAGQAGGDRGITEHLAAMIDARAWCLDLAQRASLALVAAVGGRAMTRDHPAQRLAREAAFYAVQAQTADIRAATLRRLCEVSGVGRAGLGAP